MQPAAGPTPCDIAIPLWRDHPMLARIAMIAFTTEAAPLSQGNWRDKVMDYQTINPATEELVQSFPTIDDSDLEGVIAGAHHCYRTDWSRRKIAERASIAGKAAQILRDNAAEYGGYLTLEVGKLPSAASNEVALAVGILDYYAKNAEALQLNHAHEPELSILGDVFIACRQCRALCRCGREQEGSGTQVRRVARPVARLDFTTARQKSHSQLS
jgi:hypothetical protein